MTTDHAASLRILGERGKTVDGAANDLRGRQVKDANGEGIGKVADLLVDDQENKVRFLLVEHGGFMGFGETKSLIPVDAITNIAEDDVSVDQTREHVAAAPGYSPELVADRPYQSSIYRHYGFAPFWGGGYMYPYALVNPPFSSPISKR